jgi:hypothetical protein
MKRWQCLAISRNVLRFLGMAAIGERSEEECAAPAEKGEQPLLNFE